MSLAVPFVVGQAVFVVAHAMNTEFTLADVLIIAVDVLVLIVIVAEWVWSYRREKRQDERAKRQDERVKHLQGIVAVLSDFMFKGHTIADAVPEPAVRADNTPVMEWVNSVDDWRIEVAQYLSDISSRAASAFLLVATSSSGARARQVLPEGQHPYYVQGAQSERYTSLLSHLENLRRIMEKPEVYF